MTHGDEQPGSYDEDISVKFQANYEALEEILDVLLDHGPESMLHNGRHYPALDRVLTELMEQFPEAHQHALTGGMDPGQLARRVVGDALEAIFCLGYQAGVAGVELTECPDHDGPPNPLLKTRPAPGMEKLN